MTSTSKIILDRFRPYVPEHLFRHLCETDEEIPSERRHATILFADLSGFTTISEQLDPEEIAEMTNHALEELAKPVLNRDGMVDKYIGDALMAVFGAPVSHADDPRRALEAALEMRSLMKRLTGRARKFRLSIGVHSGLVLAGNVGGRRRREYSVLGDTVNVASRLEGLAGRQEIFVSDETRRLAGPAFVYGSSRLARLKGRAEPVRVWPLLRKRVLPRGRPWKFRPVFIGRDEVIRRLRRGAAEDGVFLVVGTAGVGKSTLLRRFEEEAEAKRRIIRAGMKYGAAAEPRALLRIVAEEIRRHGDSEEKRAASIFLRNLKGRKADAAGIAAGLKGLLTAGKRPRLLLLEDVHLADEASLLVLDELGPVSGTAVIGTARPVPAPGRVEPLRHAERIEIPTFDRGTVLEMVRRLLDCRSLPRGFGRLFDHSGGLPLAVEEMIRHMVEHGMLYRSRRGWILWSDSRGGGDQALTSIIRARLDALSPNARSLVSRVSIFGIAAPWEKDRDPLAPGGAASALKEATERGILRREGGEVAFIHDLYRHVAYHTQLLKVRRGLHRKAAEWLAREERPEAVADHLLKADDGEAALPYLKRAADRAAENFAHATACEFLDGIRAVERARGRRREEAEALLRKAGSLLKLARYPETAAALRIVERMSAGKTWPEIRLELLQRQANLFKNQGKIAKMTRACRGILDAPMRRDHPAKIAALQTLAAQAWRNGNYPEAVRLYERILAIKRAGRVRSVAAGSLVDLYRMTGDYDKAEAVFDLALEDRAAGWPALHRGRILLDTGRLAEAGPFLKEALARSGRNEDLRLRTLAHRDLARLEIAEGRVRQGLEHLEDGIACAERLPAFSARAHAEAALIFARLGRRARARREHTLASQMNRKLPLVETTAVLLEAEALLEKSAARAKLLLRKLLALRRRQGARPEAERISQIEVTVTSISQRPPGGRFETSRLFPVRFRR